ncbi:MAG TPA: hypothetical protein V6C78_23820 [Crinalium sp.]|jgi:hypothetical protein
MKPSISWLEYQQLEQIIPQPAPKRFYQPSWWSTLGQALQNLFQPIVECSEIRVWQSFDESGQSWWSARDAQTGCSIHHVSEDQIRVWIEQRYR